MGVEKPNFTQVPNLFLDDLFMHMKEAELKVTLALSRQTFGYHRERVKLSLSDLKQMTHLSRQGVINGIEAGLARGTISREADGKGGYIYEIVVDDASQPSGLVNEVDQQGSQRSRPGLVHEVDYPSQRSGLPLVNEVDQYTPVLNKVVKERKAKKEKESISSPQPALTPQQEMYGAICEAMGWDYHVIAEEDRIQVAKTVKSFVAGGYAVNDIRRVMVEVWFKDWRWTEKGQRPTLKQLKQEIGKLRAGVPENVPRPGANAPATKVEGNLAAVRNVFARIREGKETQNE